MTDRITIQKITGLTEQIAKLPKGYVSKKTVNGNVYFYHQWSEDGVKKSKYLRDGEVSSVTEKIELRKKLQKELADLKAGKIRTDDMPGIIRYKLMHKREPVAELELDNETGFIQRINRVYDTDHLPVGVSVNRGTVDRASLNTWWTDRSIPASRSGVREAMEALNISDTKMLLTRCLGLCLSDQYWICPEETDIQWDDVNFFRNDFSEDIGDILFGGERKKGSLDFSSPDSTSEGNLKKRWKIINGKRCLIKGGSNPYRQEPLNEVISSRIMERLGIHHVTYTVTWNKGAPYSICEDFIDENTELVPAWRILQTKKQPNSRSLCQHFLDCADACGIPGTREFLDRMIVLDYIVLNEDRHLNNFGAVRNAETLEWKGMAPVYDSGSSLGFDKSVPMMISGTDVICKPFRKRHEEQLRLVSSFDWLDLSALEGTGEMIRNILSDKNAGDYLDERRIDVIAELTEKRIRNLESYVRKR